MIRRIFVLILLVAVLAASFDAEARRRRRHRRGKMDKPVKIDPADDPTRVCFTPPQVKRISKYPIKAGCIVPNGKRGFCAQTECIGKISTCDYDGDGKTEKAFTIVLKEAKSENGPYDYWGMFAFVSKYNTLLRVAINTRPRVANPANKDVLQARVLDRDGNPYPACMLGVNIGGTTQVFGFDPSKHGFKLQETI